MSEPTIEELEQVAKKANWEQAKVVYVDEINDLILGAQHTQIMDLVVAQGHYDTDRSYVSNGDQFYCVPKKEVDERLAELSMKNKGGN